MRVFQPSPLPLCDPQLFVRINGNPMPTHAIIDNRAGKPTHDPLKTSAERNRSGLDAQEETP